VGLSAAAVGAELVASRGIAPGIAPGTPAGTANGRHHLSSAAAAASVVPRPRLHPVTNEVLFPLPLDAGRPGSLHLDYHMSDFGAFWFNIRANAAVRLAALEDRDADRALDRAMRRACAKDLCF
jgi:hypothetical protein